MRWNKKTVRAVITAIIVAIVGFETQLMIMKALGMETHRPDIIRTMGRTGRARTKTGRRNDGLDFNDDELDINVAA